MKVKETLEIDEYYVNFPEIRRWVYISVVEARFLWLVFTGFWTALAGMVIGEMIDRFEFYAELEVPTPRRQAVLDLQAMAGGDPAYG